MQYLYQKKDGSRVKITKAGYNLLLGRNDTTHVLDTNTVKVVCIKGYAHVNVKPEPRLGGSFKQRQPYTALEVFAKAGMKDVNKGYDHGYT